MRKQTFANVPFYLYLFSFAVLGTTTVSVFGQDTSPAKLSSTTPAMPSNAKELMQLAANLNGLTGPDVQPWHIKATLTLHDQSGNVTGQGTYEEFWAGETKYRRSYSDSESTETYYGTATGVMRSGSLGSPLEPYTLVRDEIVNPISTNGQWLDRASSQQVHGKGDGKLICAGITGATAFGQTAHFVAPSYCFDPVLPALRVSVRWGQITQFLHNNVVSFQGHYLPRDLVGLRDERPVLELHLDTIEKIATFNAADFVPPPDAKPWPTSVTISSAEAQQLHLEQPAPVYPPIAVAARIQGTVVLHAILGQNGRVLSSKVVTGPAMLQQAALDAVRNWTYHPYLLNNKPADVNTTINVVFSLSPRPHAAAQ
jgi:TonB family protein